MGSPAIAPASGSVAFADAPGASTGCIGVAMDNSGDYHYMLCHIILSHPFSYGDRIQAGQVLGTVGAPGLVGNNGTSHIHMQLYTLPGGSRTPQPYAPPDGLPLEGIVMPTDGSFNQWACSGAACHGLVSSAPSDPSLRLDSGGTPATGSTAPAISAALIVGAAAVVQGTGDCVRVHSQPSTASPELGCLSDGTAVSLSGGPTQADGYTWWDLRSLGWVVADYLTPAGTPAATPATAVPPAVAAPPASAAAPVPLPAPAGTPSSPATIAVGATVRVAGTGDCLKVHATPSLAATVVTCLSDGTLVKVQAGPTTGDGHSWWQLDAGGWAVADYLQN